MHEPLCIAVTADSTSTRGQEGSPIGVVVKVRSVFRICQYLCHVLFAPCLRSRCNFESYLIGLSEESLALTVLEQRTDNNKKKKNLKQRSLRVRTVRVK